jgi:hypothetical protein
VGFGLVSISPSLSSNLVRSLCFMFLSNGCNLHLHYIRRIYSKMVRWEGHEIGVLSTVVGCVGILQGAMPKGWAKSFVHRQPVAAMSCFLFGLGIALPVTVVPLRRALGMPTNQYDAEYPGTRYPVYKALE